MPRLQRHDGLLPLPIVLSDDDVRAVRFGHKIHHRVPLRHQPALPAHWQIREFSGDLSAIYSPPGYSDSGSYMGIKSPFGAPGRRLFVKEGTYIAPVEFAAATDPTSQADPADATHRDHLGRPRIVAYSADDRSGETARCAGDFGVKLTRPRDMPGWAARTFLEVDRVWAERAELGGEMVYVYGVEFHKVEETADGQST